MAEEGQMGGILIWAVCIRRRIDGLIKGFSKGDHREEPANENTGQRLSECHIYQFDLHKGDALELVVTVAEASIKAREFAAYLRLMTGCMAEGVLRGDPGPAR
jgi:hypothetical protein